MLILNKLTAKVYANLCCLQLSTKDKNFSKDCIKEVIDYTVQTFEDDEKTYLDEWLFHFNAFDEDKEFLEAKKVIVQDLQTTYLESKEFLNIYFNIAPLILTGVIAELELTQLLSKSISEPTYVLNKTLPIQKLQSFTKLNPPSLYVQILEDTKTYPKELFIGKIGDKYIYLSTPNSTPTPTLVYDITINQRDATALITTPHRKKSTTLFNALCLMEEDLQTVIERECCIC